MYVTHTIRLDTKVTPSPEGRHREATNPPPPGSKTRIAVLNLLSSKSLLDRPKPPHSLEHCSYSFDLDGHNVQARLLSNDRFQSPAPCQSGGQKWRQLQRAAAPNSGWSSISCSTESGSLMAHNDPFVAVTLGEPRLKSVAHWAVKGPPPSLQGQLSGCSLWENITWTHPTSSGAIWLVPQA